MNKDQNGENEQAPIDSDIQAKLGEKLKDAYSDVINEPVPDRFLDLLDQLEKAEKNKDGGA
ncbi:MAG: NepR family anti-sigma factor [Pseudomonadota bacterium]